MTLRDLMDWMWEGDGTWYVQGFQNAWNILAERAAHEQAKPGTNGQRREDGHPVTPPPPEPPAGAPAWRGGPCDPLCEFSDDGLLLIG